MDARHASCAAAATSPAGSRAARRSTSIATDHPSPTKPNPPPPNARETKHLESLNLKQGEKLPPPTSKKLLSIIDWAEKRNLARALDNDEAEAQMFMEIEQRSTGRKLLQDAAGANRTDSRCRPGRSGSATRRQSSARPHQLQQLPP